MRTVRSLFWLLLFAVSASAQMRENITVSYVEVPVTVVDRAGNPIRGLTQANFELLDEGKRQSIAGFEAIDFAAREKETMAPPQAIAPAARRNFLLLFDLTFSSPAGLTRAQDAARNFATKLAERDDRIAVASIDVAHGFRLLTSFTTDHALVDAAIASPSGFKALDPLQLAGSHIDEGVAEAMNEPGANGRATDPNADTIRSINTSQDDYNRDKIDRQVTLLGGLATTLRSVRGLKHIVLLSEGFDPRLIQGRDAGMTVDQQKDQTAVERGEIWNVKTDDTYGSSSSMSLVSRLAEIAKRTDVVLDAIDIQGVRGATDFRERPAAAPDAARYNGIQRKTNEGLHLLAASTGGTVFQNANDLSENFKRALKGQEVVYVLAFQAPASTPGTFHDLKVKLVNVPGGRATARSGYYEAGAGSAAEATLSNAEIIVNDIPQDAIHVASLATPFATSGERAQVPVIVEINGNDIVNAASGTATLELYTYAFDSEGRVRDSIAHRVGLDFAKLGATLTGTGIKSYETLSLPAGKYSVKTLVRVAESNKKGYVRTEIVVPEKGAVAVSQPLFYDAGPKWVMIRGTSHDTTNAGYPFQVNGESFIPSAAVHVKGGESRRFAVFVQNAAPGDLTFETQPEAKVVSKSGDAVLFDLTGASPPPSSLQVSVKRKGVVVQTASVALVP